MTDPPEFGTPGRGPDVVDRRAAYALIRDGSGRVLAVRGPRGLFLPGGGCEVGESAEEALAREIREETGRELASYGRRYMAVQHFVAGGIPYRMTAEFFDATLGDPQPGPPEQEVLWLRPREARNRWYHASHAWAVEEAVTREDAPRLAEAVTLDFFNTLVFHRDGRGRGRALMDYLGEQGLPSAPWEHGVLYDVFASHDRAYRPSAPARERRAYRVALAVRLFERLRIPGSEEVAAAHADALWRILGPACFDVFPDAPGALRALRDRGIPLALVSNWQSGLRHFCSELGLAGVFDHVLSSADVGTAKPDRRIFLEACERLGVPPGRTLHVGDTWEDDYVGARSAGLQVVLLDRTGDSGARAARVIRSLSEVLDMVVGSGRGSGGPARPGPPSSR